MSKTTENANIGLHKCAICILLTAFMLCVLTFSCSAEGRTEELVDAKIEDILSGFSEAVPDGETVGNDLSTISGGLGIKGILEDVINAVRDGSGEIKRLLLTLIGIALISTLASLLQGEVATYASHGIAVIGAALLFERLIFLVQGTRSSLSEIGSFFGAVIPISLAVNSIGASLSTASTQAIGMGLTLGAYSFIAESLLGVVACSIFLFSALSAVDPIFKEAAKGIKNLFLSLLGALTVLLGATFALQSTISSSGDSLAIRGARYAASSAIPIVGNAVSGALGLVSGGIQYARGVVGGGSIAVVLSLMTAPLVTLFMYRICLRMGIFFTSLCSIGGCEGVLNSFLGAIDVLIAVYALTGVIYITELVAFLKGGVGVA